MPILICYDNSESARRAVSTVARTLNGDDATLLHVWSPPEKVLSDAFSAPETDHPTFAELERVSKERAGEIVEEGCALAAREGVDAHGVTRCNRSTVWETILDAADELDVQAIVIGTRGTTAVQSNLLGSVSNAVVHHSHRPVLLVPSAISEATR
jgi:nucleotide-binding universal stress UspA family protein